MYLDAFKPMFILTKNLQEQNIILRDLFKFYLETDIQLQKVTPNNVFKEFLLTALNNRKIKLFDNTVFRAGLHVDPWFTHKGSTFSQMEHLETTIVSQLLLTNILYPGKMLLYEQ